MLTPNALAILSEAHKKIATIGDSIVKNRRAGLEDSPNQDKLWTRLIKSCIYYERILKHIVLNQNKDKIIAVKGITPEQLNTLLFCLKDIAEVFNLPGIYLPIRVYDTALIGQGQQGLQGIPGQSAYIYIGYADDNIGNGYSTSPIGKSFWAVKNSNIPISPVIAATFTGLWTSFLGNDGPAGVSSYMYTGYADDNAGTGFTTVFDPNKDFIAFRSSNVVLTPVVGDFAGLWKNYKGAAGTDGVDGVDGTDGTDGNSAYVYIGYADADDGTGFTNTFNPSKDYIAFLNSPIDIGTPIQTDFDGLWKNYKGAQGDPGTNGTNGSDGSNGVDGVSCFIYIAYADDITGANYSLVKSNDVDALLSPFVTTKEYIAIITTSTSIASTITVADFVNSFTRYKGDGDRWATFSTTSITIGTGNKLFFVEKGLSYTTGQYIVVAEDGNPDNRMEGLVVNYNPVTGQMSFNSVADFGSGTFASWDVNLQAGLISPPANIYGGASPTTQTVGGIAAGTNISGFTYDALWEALLCPYQLPAFSSFSISGQSTTVEVGIILSGTKTFLWATTNSGNVSASISGSIKITDVTGSSTLGDSLANDGTEALAIGSVNHSVQATHTWRVAGINTHSGTFTRDFVVNWWWLKYYGTSTSVTLDETAIEALVSTALANTIAGTYSFASGGYKYFVWDDSLGSPTALTGFKDSATNLTMDMADSTDDAAYSNVENGWSYALVSVTNAQSVTSNKRVYRTRNILGATVNIIVS